MSGPLAKFFVEQGSNKMSIQTTHKKYDQNNNYIKNEVFDLDENESDGTQKAFSFSGPLLDVLQTGQIYSYKHLQKAGRLNCREANQFQVLWNKSC